MKKYKRSKILQRIHQNIYVEERNYLAIFMGKTGSGKSLSAVRFAQRNDKGFDLSRVVFNEDDFMSLVRSDLPAGSFIVADEIGSWLGAREYMTITNRLLSYILQTFRYKRLGIIWTVPLNRQVDITLRSMADATVETIKIHRRKQQVECKYKNVDVNPISGQVYHRFPVIRDDKGNLKTITKIFINRPERAFEDDYVKKKAIHMEEFYKDIHNKLRGLRRKEVGEVEKHGKDTRCSGCGYRWFFRGKTKPKCPRCSTTLVVVSK